MPPHFTIPEIRRRVRFRIRSMMLLVAGAGLLAWMLRDPLSRALLGLLLGTIAWAGVVMLIPMALGALGFGVVYAVERLFGIGQRKPKRLDDLFDP